MKGQRVRRRDKMTVLLMNLEDVSLEPMPTPANPSGTSALSYPAHGSTIDPIFIHVAQKETGILRQDRTFSGRL